MAASRHYSAYRRRHGEMLTEMRTARLFLRPYQRTDIDTLHRLWTDPGVRQYLWDDRIIPRQLAAGVVEGSLTDWTTHGLGQWVVCRPGSDEVIGFCGFRWGEAGTPPELLYGLSPTYWGRGLATEAARAVLTYAFQQLGIERVWAATDPPNVASIRVMERLGMRFDRRGQLNGLDTIFYTLSRSQFGERNLSPDSPTLRK